MVNQWPKRMLIPVLLSMVSFTMSLLGLALLATGHGLNHCTLVTLCLGFTGLLASALLWTIRPKALMAWPKCLARWCCASNGQHHPFHRRSKKLFRGAEVLDRDKAEMVMKNIRGIPYLIQAIQYSMETTYYTAMMAQATDGVPTTSVIHTAPKCTSVIDSDHEDCSSGVESMGSIGNRAAAAAPHVVHQTIEEWIPTGSSSWNNSQLRISINSSADLNGINVFPYSEVMPRSSGDAVLELVETPVTSSPETEERRSFLLRRPGSSKGHPAGGVNFQLRCMAMSGDFLHKFNESFRRFPR